MSTKTKQQIQNLRDALVWWQTVPEANVAPGLGFWTAEDGKFNKTHTHCGTVACFGGWCARWPGLRKQGVFVDSFGSPVMKDTEDSEEVANRLFGDADLFEPRLLHRADAGFTGTDHALVTNRIRWALEH